MLHNVQTPAPKLNHLKFNIVEVEATNNSLSFFFIDLFARAFEGLPEIIATHCVLYYASQRNSLEVPMVCVNERVCCQTPPEKLSLAFLLAKRNERDSNSL